MTKGKKSHWLRTILIVLVSCLLAGVILAVILHGANPEKNYATAKMEFTFPGAETGKGPDGKPFDPNALKSDEVLKAALQAAGMSYTAEDVRKNLAVFGEYPGEYRKQMTEYIQLFDTPKVGEYSVVGYHPTRYNVLLSGNLDSKLPAGQLTGLLNEIMKAYRNNMARAYAAETINEETLTTSPAQYSLSPILSGGFIREVIRTAGPLCVIGFLVCMVLMIISLRKEERA